MRTKLARMRVPELVHTGFLGATGTGKTHEAQREVAQLQARKTRVLVISSVDVWAEDSVRRGPCREACTVAELKADPEKLFDPDLSLALVGFDPLRPQQTAAAVKLVARLQAKYQQVTGKLPPPLLLVLDEVGSYARHCLTVLESVATLGGQHLRITLWCIAQRPAQVPITVRSQWARLVLFHLEEPADLEAVTERTHSPDIAQKLLALSSDPTNGKNFVEWSASSRSPALTAPPATPQPPGKNADPP